MAAPNIPDDLYTYLTSTLGLSDVVLYRLNPTPINQYAIVEYPGPGNTHIHGGESLGDVAFDESVLQIQSRHTSPETARDNLKTVYDSLDGLMDTTINSRIYTYITAISRVRLLDVQEDGSAIFIFEIRVQARR